MPTPLRLGAAEPDPVGLLALPGPYTMAALAAALVVVVVAVALWRGRSRRRKRRRLAADAFRSPPAGAPGSRVLMPEPADAEPAPAPPGSLDRVLGLELSPPEPYRRTRPRWVGAVAVLMLALAVAVGAILLSPVVRAPSAGGPVAIQLGEDPEPAPEAAPMEESTVGEAEDRLAVVDPEDGRQVIRWVGHGQTGRAGRPLRRALAVVVRDRHDRPLPGVDVRFVVAGEGGRVEPGTARTGDLGLATAAWWLGSNPDSLRVTAYPVDAPHLRVEFEARLEGPPGDAPATPPVRAAPEEADGGRTSAATPRPPRSRPRPARAAPAASLRPRAFFSAGGVHTCHLREAGGVQCWGADTRVTAGGPDGPGGDAPELRTVSAGVFHTCGLTGAGTVYCWPAQRGSAETAAAPAREIPLPDGAVPVDVVAGTEHSCALSAGGQVFCWGTNTHGQLGDGSTQDSAEPVRVRDLPRVVQLATGWLHTCALTEGGQTFCWGANAAGQLGDRRTADSAVPVPVPHGGTFTALTAGSAHTCALTPAGHAWCWGSNRYGQLGIGGAGSAGNPARAGEGLVFRSLTAGGVHTCGLDDDGRAWCWGRNTFGQLGIGTTDDATSPSAVAGGLRYRALQAGGAHTCGETAGGELWCWGNNVQGQIGDGTRTNRPTPVRVGQG